MGNAFASLLLGSKLLNSLPLIAYSVELRQDPLDTNVEEDVTEEYDSDSDLSLSGDDAEEDEDDGHAVPHTLTTRHKSSC